LILQLWCHPKQPELGWILAPQLQDQRLGGDAAAGSAGVATRAAAATP